MRSIFSNLSLHLLCGVTRGPLCHHYHYTLMETTNPVVIY